MNNPCEAAKEEEQNKHASMQASKHMLLLYRVTDVCMISQSCMVAS
jgi:hypothetical protein